VRITAETPIVLGSASPRRRELLGLAQIPFVVRAANADESTRPGEGPSDYIERIACAKLEAVRAALATVAVAHADAILVADTVVVGPDGSVLGKPRDADDGRAMLERLSGRSHTVRTRFLLAEADAETQREPLHGETVVTEVTFRELSPGEIARYVASGEGRDKAGGYAVQGGAAAFTARIDGSYTNVVGLPLCEVQAALRRLGWISAS
jgi:septum formation protein